MSASYEEIRLRHEQLERMVQTQSSDLLVELRSQAHQDRGWLLQALESATEQNELLSGELERLSVAVGQIEARPRRRKSEALV